MTLGTHTDVVDALGPRLREEFQVVARYVFGSAACGDDRQGSDVDLLVDFDGPATFAGFMDLEALLEDALAVRVDLVTRKALRPHVRPRIEAAARRVA